MNFIDYTISFGTISVSIPLLLIHFSQDIHYSLLYPPPTSTPFVTPFWEYHSHLQQTVSYRVSTNKLHSLHLSIPYLTLTLHSLPFSTTLCSPPISTSLPSILHPSRLEHHSTILPRLFNSSSLHSLISCAFVGWTTFSLPYFAR